jgi:hypothetical protein
VLVAFEGDGCILDQETLIREYIDTHSMADTNPVSSPTFLHQDNESAEPLDSAQVKIYRNFNPSWRLALASPDAHIEISLLPCIR